MKNQIISSDTKTKAFTILVNFRTLLILALLVIIAAIGSPYFLKTANLINILRQVSVISIIGVGFTLVVCSSNLDFSVGAMITLIGIITAMLSKIPGMPFWAVIFIGLAIGAALGYFNSLVCTFLNVPLFIVTFALAIVYEGVGYLLTKNATVTNLAKEYAVIGQGYVGVVPIPVLIMLVVVCIFLMIVYRTRLGRYAVAMGGNTEAARVSGVNIVKTRAYLLILMGICSAIGGFILTGRAASAQTTAGLDMTFDALTAVVIGGTSVFGGKGNIFGTFIGALIVGVINNGLNLIGVDSNWQIVAKGAMILIAVFIDRRSQAFFKIQALKLK